MCLCLAGFGGNAENLFGAGESPVPNGYSVLRCNAQGFSLL